jgi:hypothetical protein
MSGAKLTHAVLLDGGMFVDSTAGDSIRFFSKSRLKERNEVKGPLIAASRAFDERFLNLFLYSPQLYQATQRAKLDAKDIQYKISTALLQDEITLELAELFMKQLSDMIIAVETAQKAALEGIDFQEAIK